jgi:hypothetical protein
VKVRVAVKGWLGIEIRIGLNPPVSWPFPMATSWFISAKMPSRTGRCCEAPVLGLRGLTGLTGWAGLVGLSGLGEGLKVKRCGREHQDYEPSYRDYACAVERRWTTAGESPARELGSLYPEAIRAAEEETKPSEPLV